jgi:hypothetical protein
MQVNGSNWSMLLPNNCPQDHSHQPITMAERWRGDSSQWCRRSRKNWRCSRRRGCVDLAVQPTSTMKGRRSSSRGTALRRHGERRVRGAESTTDSSGCTRGTTTPTAPGHASTSAWGAPHKHPMTNRLESARTAPNSGELGFLRSGTSAANRANRPGWQCRSAKSGAFATDGGGKRRRSRTEAAVSGEGGVGVEQGSARWGRW